MLSQHCLCAGLPCWNQLQVDEKQCGKKRCKDAEMRMRGVVCWSLTYSCFFSPYQALIFVLDPVLDLGIVCTLYSPNVTFKGRLNSDSKHILLKMD